MDTDLELCKFYTRFFSERLQLNKKGNLKKFEKFLKPQKKLENVFGETEQSSFSENHYLRPFAYIFENNMYVSSTVSALFKSLLDKNTNLLRSYLGQDVISICCFSDGSCAEIVSIVQVLAKALENIFSHLLFNVTIVCYKKHWIKTSLKVLKFLEEYKLYREQVQFIVINPSEELPNKVQQAIKNADIVTMVKIFSEIENCTRKFSEIYKDIFHHLKLGSIIFFMDSAYRNFYYAICRQFSSCIMLDHKRCYKHLMNLEIIKDNFKPFENAFENYYLVSSEKVSFGFWIKEENSGSRLFVNSSNVPVNTSKSVQEKTIGNTCFHLDSSKKSNARQSELAFKIAESALTRNFNYGWKKRNIFEPKLQPSSDTPPVIGKNMNHNVGQVWKKKTEVNVKNVQTKKTDTKNNNIPVLEQLIPRTKKGEKEQCKHQSFSDRKIEITIYSHISNRTISGASGQIYDDTAKVIEQQYRDNMTDCQNCYPGTIKYSQLKKGEDNKIEEVFKCQEKSINFLQKKYFPETNGKIDNHSYNGTTTKLGRVENDATEKAGTIEEIRVVSKALEEKKRVKQNNKTEFDHEVLSRKFIEIGNCVNNSKSTNTSECKDWDGDEVKFRKDHTHRNSNTFCPFKEKCQICIAKNFSEASLTKQKIASSEIDSKLISINRLNKKLTANEDYNLTPSTTTTQQSHLSKSKLPSELRPTVKRQMKWYKKESISSKSITESQSRFCEPYNQTTSTSERETAFLQGKATIIPEREQNSFNSGCKSSRIIISKPFDEVSFKDNFSIISLTNKSADFLVCVRQDVKRLWSTAELKVVNDESVFNDETKGILKSIFAIEDDEDCGVKQKKLVEDKPNQLTSLNYKDNKNELQQNVFANLNNLNFSRLLEKKAKTPQLSQKKKKKTAKKKKAAKKKRKSLSKQARKEQNSESEQESIYAVMCDCGDDDDDDYYEKQNEYDDLHNFVPYFNRSRPKNQRWDFWWTKWNWV